MSVLSILKRLIGNSDRSTQLLTELRAGSANQSDLLNEKLNAIILGITNQAELFDARLRELAAQSREPGPQPAPQPDATLELLRVIRDGISNETKIMQEMMAQLVQGVDNQSRLVNEKLSERARAAAFFQDARDSAAADDGHPELIFQGRAPDVAGMREAVARNGCFVIRGLFDRSGIARVLERAVFATRAWEFMIARGYAAGHDDFLRGAYSAGHIPGEDIDGPQTFADIATGSSYDLIAEELFGTISRDYALRRSMMAGKPNPLGFHQDGFFSPPGFNFWTPLEDAGVTRPGLEVVIGSGGPVLSHEVVRHDVASFILERFGRERLWHPEIRAGDALVFTTFMMHRTYLTETMNPTRYSLELRGRITKRIPIAGVRAEHWDAPLAGSIAEFEAGAAQGLISGAPGHRGGRGAHASAPTHRPDAPPA
jgi:hypothetical protein